MTRPTFSPLRVLAAIILAFLTAQWFGAIAGNSVPRGKDRARWETPTSYMLVPPLRADNPKVQP